MTSARWLLIAVIGLVAASLPASVEAGPTMPVGAEAADAEQTPPLLTGSFIQESTSLDEWSPQRWDRELTQMGRAGIKTVILQWTLDEDNGRALYPAPATWYPRGPDYVTPLLSLAPQHGANVWLGLANVGAWQSHASDYAWMYNQLYVAEQVADQLYSLFGEQFAGWYLPFEVDDSVLSTPAAVTNLRWFFDSLDEYLHSHDGDLPVMASATYASLTLSPPDFAALVADVLGALDVVAVQDLGGSGYVGPSDIANWFSALKSALAGTGVSLWDDADMFANGSPMPPEQLQADLAAACPYVQSIVGFSFPTQMDPDDLGMRPYYRAYRRYLSSSPKCS